jgi:putative flippase GtrA
MLLAARLLPPPIRDHRPAADREGSPQPDAADGRAAIDDPDSPVDMPGFRRPTVRSIADEARSFATIGIASTIAYVVLFTALRLVASATIANAVALFVTAIGNTAANRRLTFGKTDRASLLRDHAVGLAAFGIALAITTGAVGLLERVAPNPGRALEITVLVAANALATVARFVFLRSWISAEQPSRSTPYDQLEGSPS